MRRRAREYGDKRTKSGFLFFPKSGKTNEGDESHWESRWLENATWEQELTGGRGEAWWDHPTWTDEGEDVKRGISPTAIIVLLMVLVGACLIVSKMYGLW